MTQAAPTPKPPKGDHPRCDVLGCGMPAVHSTDGTEMDEGSRKAVPLVNVCAHHANWPHSEDARAFVVLNTGYQTRKG